MNYALPIIKREQAESSPWRTFGVLLKSIAALSSQPKFRSPHLLAGILSRTGAGISAHFKIVRLFKDPVLAETLHDNPRLAFKYLAGNYLVRDLPITIRATCFLFHYERLRSILPVWLLRQALLSEIPLVELCQKDLGFAITMSLSRAGDTEGELSLNLVMNGQVVYTMGFSIVPGWVAQASAREILLITRLQSTKGLHQELSQASRALCHVSPIVLLMAALQGVAGAFGIDTMACVSGARQISYDEKFAEIFQRSYDDFFEQRGISPNSGGFFVTPFPLKEKSINDLNREHKIRAVKRRAFRQKIQQACADFFARNGLPTPSTEA